MNHPCDELLLCLKRPISHFLPLQRYVDDICTALPESLIQQFLDDLNSIEQSIKFTFEVEENEKLAFLDTAITHHKDGSLTTSVYRKKTHTDKYLSFESHHPIAHKLSVVNTLFSTTRLHDLLTCSCG